METVCFDYSDEFWHITVDDCERINRNYRYLILYYEPQYNKPLIFPTNKIHTVIEKIDISKCQCYNLILDEDSCLKFPRDFYSLVLIDNRPGKDSYYFEKNKLVMAKDSDQVVITRPVEALTNYFL